VAACCPVDHICRHQLQQLLLLLQLGTEYESSSPHRLPMPAAAAVAVATEGGSVSSAAPARQWDVVRRV